MLHDGVSVNFLLVQFSGKTDMHGDRQTTLSLRYAWDMLGTLLSGLYPTCHLWKAGLSILGVVDGCGLVLSCDGLWNCVMDKNPLWPDSNRCHFLISNLCISCPSGWNSHPPCIAHCRGQRKEAGSKLRCALVETEMGQVGASWCLTSRDQRTLWTTPETKVLATKPTLKHVSSNMFKSGFSFTVKDQTISTSSTISANILLLGDLSAGISQRSPHNVVRPRFPPHEGLGRLSCKRHGIGQNHPKKTCSMMFSALKNQFCGSSGATYRPTSRRVAGAIPTEDPLKETGNQRNVIVTSPNIRKSHITHAGFIWIQTYEPELLTPTNHYHYQPHHLHGWSLVPLLRRHGRCDGTTWLFPTQMADFLASGQISRNAPIRYPSNIKKYPLWIYSSNIIQIMFVMAGSQFLWCFFLLNFRARLHCEVVSWCFLGSMTAGYPKHIETWQAPVASPVFMPLIWTPLERNIHQLFWFAQVFSIVRALIPESEWPLPYSIFIYIILNMLLNMFPERIASAAWGTSPKNIAMKLRETNSQWPARHVGLWPWTPLSWHSCLWLVAVKLLNLALNQCQSWKSKETQTSNVSRFIMIHKLSCSDSRNLKKHHTICVVPHGCNWRVISLNSPKHMASSLESYMAGGIRDVCCACQC